MENKELDIMLSKALKPSYAPSDALNKALIEKLRNKGNGGNTGGGSEDGNVVEFANKKTTKKNSGKTVHFLIRAAITMLILTSVGAVGVYAANYFLKKTTVYDHGISVGNQEYTKDEDLAEPWEPVPETKEGTFEGGPDDKWEKKEVVLTNGVYRNSYYYYPDYESAIEDTMIDNLFSEPIGEATSICFVETVELSGDEIKENGYKEYELDSWFSCNGKAVFLSQAKQEGVEEDAAYSVIMNKTDNERNYTSKSGIEFTLVDDIEAKVNGGTEDGISTYVMISYGDVSGFMIFEEMQDDEIHEILDKVVVE